MLINIQFVEQFFEVGSWTDFVVELVELLECEGFSIDLVILKEKRSGESWQSVSSRNRAARRVCQQSKLRNTRDLKMKEMNAKQVHIIEDSVLAVGFKFITLQMTLKSYVSAE